ncbi:MAG: hypothetical protein ACXAD7_06085 [Candidatus Kariarchaeaceae archaeon]
MRLVDTKRNVLAFNTDTTTPTTTTTETTGTSKSSDSDGFGFILVFSLMALLRVPMIIRKRR